MVIPPHTIAADPTTTTNFKLFLGGWMSLRHLDKFPELNLEIALAEVWLLEESKENNFARRAWRVAIMLLYDTCLVISCPLIVVPCVLIEIHFSKKYYIIYSGQSYSIFFFFWEGTVTNLAIWLVPNPVRQVEYLNEVVTSMSVVTSMTVVTAIVVEIFHWHWLTTDNWHQCQWNVPLTLIVWQSDIFHLSDRVRNQSDCKIFLYFPLEAIPPPKRSQGLAQEIYRDGGGSFILPKRA